MTSQEVLLTDANGVKESEFQYRLIRRISDQFIIHQSTNKLYSDRIECLFIEENSE